jgi:hypothetical protein
VTTPVTLSLVASEHACGVEGCEASAAYVLTFGELSKTFCEACLARRVVELLVFD